MNIFYLDSNPRICARYHCDKHVIKMMLESAQLLCTALNIVSGTQVTPYKSTHINHPCSIWVRESFDNWAWTFNLMLELEKEWQYRFNHNRQHLAISKLAVCEPYGYLLPIYAGRVGMLPHRGFTSPALVMPDYCKIPSDPIASYRNYYNLEKKHIHNWTNREVPEWIV